MRTQSRRKQRQGGMALVLLALMLLTVMLPMLGLGIDMIMLYAVRARLSAAVDGAALAAGRSLDPARSFDAQKAKVERIAQQFLDANFPHGYWGATNGAEFAPGTDVVANQQGARIVIDVSAHADVPLLFARVFGWNASMVASSAQAVRRFVRLVLVLDRSGSMTGGPIAELKDASKDFVNMFSPTRDDLGLVVFGGSGIVAYPPRDPMIVGGGGMGPDGGFMNATSGIPTMINTIVAGSDTGMTEALVLAHQELRKDWANHALFLNVIVLFTDGMPNGVMAGWNGSVPARLYPTETPSAGAISVIRTNLPRCDNYATGSAQILGWMAQCSGNTFPNNPNGCTTGAHVSMQTKARAGGGNTADVKSWLAYGPNVEPLTTTNTSGCNFNSGETRFYLDILRYPTEDVYGNRLDLGNLEYQHSLHYRRYGGALNMTGVRNPYQIGLVGWNATVDASRRIRRDPDLKPVILAIGYTGGGGIDTALLRRIVNSSTDFDVDYTLADYDPSPTTTTGRYYLASAGGIDAAFRQVASEILRLSQ